LAATALNFVREVPAFAGAVLGFTGVIVTLIVNAYLARRQEQRREDRDARGWHLLRSCASKEKRCKTTLHLQALPATLRKPLSPCTDMITGKLGVLHASEVAAVFQAYLPLRSMTWRLRLLEQIRSVRHQRSDDHVWLPINDIEMVRAMHANHIPAVDAAITELERHL
jgi:hypothetical protein